MNPDSARDLFFDEAAELLRDFEEGLLRLEQHGHDAEVLNRVFRSAHTLKGNSGMLGFEAVARFTHGLENLLARLRSGELPATRPIMDTLLVSADVLRELLEHARTDARWEGSRSSQIIEAIQVILRTGGATVPSVAGRPSRVDVDESVLYEIRFAPPRDLLRRGLDPVRILETLGELGELTRVEPDLSALPSLQEMDPEAAYLGFTCWLLTREPRTRIEACFEFVAEPSAVRIEVRDGRAAGASAAGGAPTRQGLLERRSGRDRRAGGDGGEASRGAEATTIRVSAQKVDRLMDLVGELVITQSMVAQLVTRFTPDRLGQLSAAVAQMDRHARDLQERVMAVRMLPIRTVFSRFPRLVRDLAQAQRKEVLLETSGDETELDKSVIEQISDPLAHLVRNALDHGIESPEVRRQAGKPAAGRLTLRAYQQGGNIYIEVTDDGAGLHRERILAKAVQLGILSADDAPADEQVFALIFRPGFSTAERITEVSGRGVGMDVVKRNLEAFGGSIATQTERGRGTTFRLKLPLTLAILDGQSVRVGAETYVLPLVSIVESIQPKREQLSRVFGAGEAITIRGQVLPMLRLHRLFGVTPSSEDPTEGLVVIVEHERGRVALLVDELMGQQQVVIKSLETNFQKLEGVNGATILGDGRVALILDVPGLLAISRSATRHGARLRATGTRGEVGPLVEVGR